MVDFVLLPDCTIHFINVFNTERARKKICSAIKIAR